MRHERFWMILAMTCILGGALSASAVPTPLLEYKFNETGTAAASSGSVNAGLSMYLGGALTDLHSANAGGVTGLAGDQAFDNTLTAGMGGAGGCATMGVDNDNLDGLASFTICCWVKVPPTTNPNVGRVYRKRNSSDGIDYYVTYNPSGNTISLTVYVNGISNTYSSITNVSNWNFIVITFDGSLSSNQLKFYGGTAASSVTLLASRTLSATSVIGNGSAVCIGDSWLGGGRAFDGLIDNFRLYGSKMDATGALSLSDLEAIRVADDPYGPSLSVTAGTINSCLPDTLDRYNYDNGTLKLLRLTNKNTAGKTWAAFTLDVGSAQTVDSLTLFNRTDVSSLFNIQEIEIYVGDESSGRPATFDTLVYSGIPGNASGPGIARPAIFTQAVQKRYFMFKVKSSFYGTLDGSTNRVYADFGDIQVVPASTYLYGPSLAVTAGTINAYLPDTVDRYANTDGTTKILRLTNRNLAAKTCALFGLDLGTAQDVSSLVFFNRTDYTSRFSIREMEIYVGDETLGRPISFDTLIYSGVPGRDVALVPISTPRRATLTSPVHKRYFMLKVKSNFYGILDGSVSEQNYADFGDIKVLHSDTVDASTFGYSSTDATSALQAAINTGAKVVNVPNMGTDWIVTSIYLVSDQEIVFADGVNVMAKRGEFHDVNDCLFYATELGNLKLTGINATFRMWKSDYADPNLYTAGEWRHGIRVYACDNVSISGITVRETGGDGIYLGSSTADRSIPCSNITIRDIVCDNNYRQGMSAISVHNLTMDNCTLRATSGTAPMSGIDFEPNYAVEQLTNITLTNCVIEANQGDGIMFYTDRLASPTTYGARVENCTFYGNASAALSMRYPSSSLIVKDCLFVNNGYGLYNSRTPSFVPTYCGFWGNTITTSGPVTLGTGCLTAVQPLFGSTTFGNADYMYLALNCPASITTGASDGGFIGARPIVGTVMPTPTPTPLPTPTPTPGPILGDANRDGVVSFADFAALQNYYGQSGMGWDEGDFNGDGRVTFEDFSILQNHYGETGTAGSALGAATAATGVPCSALGLLLMAAIGLSLLFLRNQE